MYIACIVATTMLIATLSYLMLIVFGSFSPFFSKQRRNLINIIALLIIKELEDKLAHKGVKPNARQLAESKEEKPTAPYWFEDGIKIN